MKKIFLCTIFLITSHAHGMGGQQTEMPHIPKIEIDQLKEMTMRQPSSDAIKKRASSPLMSPIARVKRQSAELKPEFINTIMEAGKLPKLAEETRSRSVSR